MDNAVHLTQPHILQQSCSVTSDQQCSWSGAHILTFIELFWLNINADFVGKLLSKACIISKAGAGQHGMATMTVCACFGMEHIVYMGAKDAWRQALNAFCMNILDAKVVPIKFSSKALKDAVNEAMRDWVVNLATMHFLIRSCFSPHLFPTIAHDYQKGHWT
ncbi:tryptophan synthase beta subunit-like PLP-dependent enzyme [Pisolithus albus]|nr:tryptophan synthase beta subunit-like PLP-dependent enzyme [Pisolithus albus]